jgi:hypothetical protein
MRREQASCCTQRTRLDCRRVGIALLESARASAAHTIRPDKAKAQQLKRMPSVALDSKTQRFQRTLEYPSAASLLAPPIKWLTKTSFRARERRIRHPWGQGLVLYHCEKVLPSPFVDWTTKAPILRCFANRQCALRHYRAVFSDPHHDPHFVICVKVGGVQSGMIIRNQPRVSRPP